MARTTGIFGACLLAACGSVNGSPDGAVSLDTAPLSDATPLRCDPTRPFEAPQPVTALNSNADDVTAWLTADELTVMFASQRPGGLVTMIFTSRRAPRWTEPSGRRSCSTA